MLSKRLYPGSTEQGITNQTLANKWKLNYLSVAEALVHRLVYFLKYPQNNKSFVLILPTHENNNIFFSKKNKVW